MSDVYSADNHDRSQPSRVGHPGGGAFESLVQPLFLNFMRPVYASFAQPFGFAFLRVVTGVYLMISGWPKITAPMAQVAFLDGFGMYPGWFWSPFLAALQFFGGAALIAGLLTRPVALANAVMMLLTLVYHVGHPYPGEIFTPEGLAAMQAAADQYLTGPAQAILLKDNGVRFLDRVQEKAELASIFWSGAVALFAAFGGGRFSVDRLIGREF